MLNINFSNFARYSANLYKTNKTQNYTSAPKVRSNNLAPLAHDCISFTSKNANLNKSLYEAFDNTQECHQVSENARRVEGRLERTLRDSLQKFLFSEKSNPHGTILNISTRVKSADSIKEKLAGELEYAITQDKSRVFNPNNPDEIKTALGDIVGARIILRKSEQNETSKIIDSLIKDVEAGRIKITKIENYEPANCDSKLKYFQKQDLIRLQEAANKRRKPHEPKVELVYSSKKSGYMALHIDVDLSDENLPAKNNNYTGEIQIIGRDVEILKDVEDFLYKLRQNKAIRGGHSAYSAFCNYWTKFSTPSEQYPNLDADMMKYTARAYIEQRKKEPIRSKKGYSPYRGLPTIAQCGMQGKIPPELDFNTLYKIKKLSDELYSLTSNSQ